MTKNWLNTLLEEQELIKHNLKRPEIVMPLPTSESKAKANQQIGLESSSLWDPTPEKPWSPPLSGFALYQKALAWERAIKLALKPYQLTHLQWLVLTYLAGLTAIKHKPTVTEIAHCLSLDPPTTTQVLQALTKKNLVHKLRQGNAYQVSATADGRIIALKSRSLILGVEPQ